MTKQELLETYTAEQLAETVIAQQQLGKNLLNIITKGDNEIPIDSIKWQEDENAEKTLIEKYQKNIDEWKKKHPYNIGERLETQKLIKEIRRDENGIWLNMCDADFIQNYSKMQKTISDDEFEIDRLKSEVEKYRKAFEEGKEKHDRHVAAYWKEVDELKQKLGRQETATKYAEDYVDSLKKELDYSKNTINQIDCILEKLFGIRHNTVDTPDEFEKILSDKAKENIADFLPTEPIKVADMLINAEGEYEHSPIAKALYKEDKGAYRIFDVLELRQIAEHLLVYCNNNGEAVE